MKTIFLYILLLTAISPIVSLAQSNKTVKRIKIGDTVPDITITNLINYRSKTAKLSDFKGKILIIDYWATWCGSCIHAFPEDEELQKKFDGKVQFLLVTAEKNKVVTDFIARSKKYKKNYPHLVYVSDDTLFHKLIKIDGYPSYAWIDGNGVFRNLNNYDDVNEKNITDLINKKVPIKEEKVDIDLMRPFFMQGNGGEAGPLLSYSILTKYAKQLYPWCGSDMKKDTGYIYYTNYPLMLLYEQAFYDEFALRSPGSREIEQLYAHTPGLFRIPNSRVILELKDTSEVVPYVNDKPNTDNTYCYQQIMAHATFPKMRAYMKNDLGKYFHYNVRIEKRKVQCLILTSGDTTLIASKGGKTEKKIEGYNYSFTNYPFYRLKAMFNYGFLLPPLIDETGYKGNIDLTFTANTKDWKSIATAFKKYKLKLSLEQRDIEMLVIGDPIKESVNIGTVN